MYFVLDFRSLCRSFCRKKNYEFAVVFYNYVTRLAEGFDRLDVVFDCYFKNSLKAQARKGRGSSVTRVLQITDDVPFPRNFLTSFLCNTDNKRDLGLYLAFAVMLVIRTSCATHNNSVISFPPTVNIQCFQFPVQLKKLIKKLFDMLFIVSKSDTLL